MVKDRDYYSQHPGPDDWIGRPPRDYPPTLFQRAWQVVLAVLAIIVVVLASIGAGVVMKWWDHRKDVGAVDLAAHVETVAFDPAKPWTVVGQEIDRTALRVIDGDTIAVGRLHIRIENLDAPEMPGRARCEREAALALAARDKMAALLAAPGEIDYLPDQARQFDRYGRTLARVTVRGEDVAGPMIAAGVARPWRGRSSDWCASGS